MIDEGREVRKVRALFISDVHLGMRPTRIAQLNDFLRWHDAGIRRNLGMESATDAEVFAELRKRKEAKENHELFISKAGQDTRPDLIKAARDTVARMADVI